MGAILRNELLNWYTQLNNARAKIGLTAVSPSPSSLTTVSSIIDNTTGQALKTQIDALQFEYNFTGTYKCTLDNSEFEDQTIKASLKTKIDTVMASLDSVNVAQISYSQTTNSNGINSNGTCNNGVNIYGTKAYTSKANGTNDTRYNEQYPCTNGTNGYGSHYNGTQSYGKNSLGTYSNGCTETSNTRETTYTNT